jgi:hypothetical protein
MPCGEPKAGTSWHTAIVLLIARSRTLLTSLEMLVVD